MPGEDGGLDETESTVDAEAPRGAEPLGGAGDEAGVAVDEEILEGIWDEAGDAVVDGGAASEAEDVEDLCR